MDTEELIASDLILLLMAAPTRWQQARDRINGITRLEKLLFIINEECKQAAIIDEPFRFIAYHYGPYSKDIYDAVGLLETANLLKENRKYTDSDLDESTGSDLDLAEELLYSDTTTEIFYERQFTLTEDGKTIANYLAEAHPRLQRQIERIKDQYAGLTLQNLIFRVYNRYPRLYNKPTIRDRIGRT